MHKNPLTPRINRRNAIQLFGLIASSMGLLGSSIKGDSLITRHKLGKTPARHVAKLNLGDYIKSSKLPSLPDNFGNENLVPNWGMLGNDSVGDCAFAGPFHALQLWCALGKKPVNITTDAVLKAYSAVTGYNPSAWNPATRTNPTDNGSDVHEVAEYWRTTGLVDADEKVHKIDCYLALEPGNVEQLYHAMYLFQAVGIGINCPEEYQRAFFNNHQPWDKIANPTIEGGHYILGVGRRNSMINTVTWGAVQPMTAAGYQQFNDETYVYLDEEMLINNKDVNGFDVQQLMFDMSEIANERGGK